MRGYRYSPSPERSYRRRGRSYSYSPSPERSYRSRGRRPSPKDRYGSRGRDLATSLLVRNLRRDCRTDDLRRPFEEFGPIKDVYLPRDYYTGEPRGFGFVQYLHPEDAADAKYEMDGQLILGREITVLFAEENHKKPSEMRARQRYSQGRVRDRTRSPPRYSRTYSRSPRRYSRAYSRSPNYYSPSPRGRYYSRSVSPRDESYRGISYSRSPHGSISRSVSPERYRRSRSRSRGSSVSRSPVSDDYSI